MMKTYVVNMEKDTHKRVMIECQLLQHPELDWNIWKAVEGKKLSWEEQEEMVHPDFFERYGRNATLPAVGCSLSHYHIYKDMIEKNIRYALILEDDAILSQDLKLESVISLLQTEEPTAILFTPDFWYRKENRITKIDSKYSIYSIKNGYMTSGYAINLASAKLLASKVFPIQYTADAWGTFTSWGVKLYGIVPHIISFPDGYGEIGLSQNTKKTLYEKFRAIVIFFYIRMLWMKNYVKGNRHSRKLWK